MTTALREQVGKVQSAATRLRWTWAVGQFVAWELAALGLLAGFDALVRFSTPLGRWLLAAAALAATGRLAQRYLWPCFRLRVDLVATARRIEAQYPHLAEHLSGAIAFLQTPAHDPAAGSLAMRQAVIATAEKLTAALDLAAVLDPRPARRALGRALVACLVCVAIAVWQPQAVRIALTRLFFPWSETAWPRRHELALVNPPRSVAAGSEVTLTLVDRRGKLPEVVELWVEPATAAEPKALEPSERVRRLAGGGPTLALPLGSVHQALRYRVRGGDDDTMPWQTLEVVPPPAIRQLRVLVTPPAYTGLPPQEAGTSVQALVGSQLVLTVELDRAVARGQLRMTSAASYLPAAAEAGGRRWTVGRSPTWQMEQADTAELELFAADGTKFVPLRLHLTPVLDQPPGLNWSLPEDEAVATPQTLLRVAAQVQDDYGVRQVVLRAMCEAEGLETTFPLHSAAEPPGVRRRALPASPEEPSPAALPDTTDMVAIDTGLPLSGWPARPGQVWMLSLHADDFKPQTAQTPPRRLRIVSVAELKQLLAARRQAVLEQLVEALRRARQLREELAQARQRAERAFTPEDALRLQAIQYGLAQVADALAAEPGGAEEKLAALLAELRAHGLAEDAQGQPLAQWLGAVRALNQEAIPAVEQRLAQVHEAVQAALASAPQDAAQQGRAEVAASLAAAHDEHSKLVRSLEEMLGVVQRWEALARMARQVSELERHQQALTGQIEEVQLQALTATGEQAAALRALGRRLAQQQAELAGQVEELHAAAEEMASQPAADDPDATARLQAAHSALRQAAIGSTMRQGAMQLAQGQYDAAAALARQALEKLRHLDAIFQGTKPPTATVPAPTPDATWHAPLAALVASQQKLATSVAQLDAASASPPARPALPTSRELAARQGRLAYELETLQPNMPRLFQWVAEEAHRAMRQCQQLLEAGQTGTATQQAAQNALELLQQLQKAGAADASRPGAATEPSAPPHASAPPDDPRLAELKLVLLWQEWIARQTAAMQRQRPPDGSWTPAQRDAIEDLARQQQRLAQALQALSEAPAKTDAAQP